MKENSILKDCQLAFFSIIFILCSIYMIVLLYGKSFCLPHSTISAKQISSVEKVDSIKIVYCSETFECPAAILPQKFEDGAFLRYRDSLVIKDCNISNRLNGNLKKLRRYKNGKNFIDTRGKISLYFSNQSTQVWYYDRFLLQQKNDSICYKWTKKLKLFLNSIVRTSKKKPVFQKMEIDVRYDDELNIY